MTTSTTTADLASGLSKDDVAALRKANEIVVYHGVTYRGASDSIANIIVKWTDRLAGDVERNVQVYSYVSVYDNDYDNRPKHFQACSHGVYANWETQGALKAFIHYVKPGDVVTAKWIRSTNGGNCYEGTQYNGLMHDRIALHVERGDMTFPLTDEISFDGSVRMVRSLSEPEYDKAVNIGF